jgi:Ssp1 endopeptidase immunity protein Rap1a
MKFLLITMVVIVLSPSFVHAAAPDSNISTARRFYEACAAVETFETTNDAAQTRISVFCLGYAQGLFQAILAADLRHVNKTFCPPPDITNLQVVRGIRKYIETHPEKAYGLTGILAVDALRAAFPCST